MSDIGPLCRIYLQANPPAIVQVPLVVSDFGDIGYATDIEVLDGDGTSVIVCTSGGYLESMSSMTSFGGKRATLSHSGNGVIGWDHNVARSHQFAAVKQAEGDAAFVVAGDDDE